MLSMSAHGRQSGAAAGSACSCTVHAVHDMHAGGQPSRCLLLASPSAAAYMHEKRSMLHHIRKRKHFFSRAPAPPPSPGRRPAQDTSTKSVSCPLGSALIQSTSSLQHNVHHVLGGLFGVFGVWCGCGCGAGPLWASRWERGRDAEAAVIAPAGLC